MISGEWFQRKRSKNWQKNCTKLPIHNSMKNVVSTLILTNLVGVLPRNIHTKLGANLCIGLRA